MPNTNTEQPIYFLLTHDCSQECSCGAGYSSPSPTGIFSSFNEALNGARNHFHKYRGVSREGITEEVYEADTWGSIEFRRDGYPLWDSRYHIQGYRLNGEEV
jgi:hypothetical protein